MTPIIYRPFWLQSCVILHQCNTPPSLDFSEESLPTETVELAINVNRSDATTPAVQALGLFTERKLQKLDTRDKRQACKRNQLNQFARQNHMANLLNQFFFALTGSTLANVVVHNVRLTVVMVHPALHLCYMG